MAARKYTPAKGGRTTFRRVFRRILGIGFEERQGTLKLERVTMDRIDPSANMP